MGRLIAFVHIPKTGGGTLKSVFGASAACEARKLSPNPFRPRGPELLKRRLAEIEAERADAGDATYAVVGHVPYGFLLEHLPPDTRYVTFLREPVDHALSRFYRHPNYGLSLEEALEHGLPVSNDNHANRIPMDNLATRFLVSRASLFGELDPDAVEDAKRNLAGFACVGLTERFDESVALLEQRLGLGLVPNHLRHVSPDRPRAGEIDEQTRALIEAHNRLDAELYAFASELLEKQLAAAADLAADVERLRFLSEQRVPREKAENRDRRRAAGRAARLRKDVR